MVGTPNKSDPEMAIEICKDAMRESLDNARDMGYPLASKRWV